MLAPPARANLRREAARLPVPMCGSGDRRYSFLFPRSLGPSVPVFLLRVEGCANLKFCAVYAESWSVSAHFSASRDGFPWVTSWRSSAGRASDL